jgi:hypothetical protein
MKRSYALTRRDLLRRVAAGLTLARQLVPASVAAEPASLKPGDPEARAVHYVEDAATVKEASSGANCSNCSIYSARNDSAGTCTLFKDKMVKAAGWCTAWSGL